MAETLLCLGIDPDPSRISGDGPALERCRRHVEKVLEAVPSVAAFKPNLAYFEQFGSPGLAWLEDLIPRLKLRAPVILDAKRGDIGPSSQAYARALFETWDADAVTVSPWMGLDSIEPFLSYQRTVYVLLHTSNPGARDLQHDLWRKLLDKLCNDWKRPGLGAVVGATKAETLAEVASVFDGPLLIPGVGSQGGDAQKTVQALGKNPWRARINVSSGILYADDPIAACRKFASDLTPC